MDKSFACFTLSFIRRQGSLQSSPSPFFPLMRLSHFIFVLPAFVSLPPLLSSQPIGTVSSRFLTGWHISAQLI